MQLGGLVEELEREPGDLLGMRLGIAAPAGEALHRRPPDGAGIVGPVRRVVVPDGVEQDPLAQGPFADRHLVELEHVHRRRQEHRPGDDEVDAARFEPDHPASLGRLRREDLVVQREELVARERELVERRRHLNAAADHDHGGEVLEGAAAPDHELGLERSDLSRDAAERGRQVCTKRASICLRDRVGVDEVGGEAGDAEVLARRPQQLGGGADHHLEAAAAEVEAQRGSRLEQHACADCSEDQTSLGDPVDHIDLDAGLALDAVDELVAVRSQADGAGRAGHDLGRVGGLGEHLHPPYGRDRDVGRFRRDETLAAHAVAEPQHLLLPGERREAPVGMHVRDQQVERIRSQIERRDAHRARL